MMSQRAVRAYLSVEKILRDPPHENMMSDITQCEFTLNKCRPIPGAQLLGRESSWARD